MQMLKYLSVFLLVLTFIISGCSFADLDNKDLATWSINLEFPILMTSFDATELLGDIDQIEKRYDPESGDSIFVFKSNTLIDIEVKSFTVTTSGGEKDPLRVTIEPIEQEIEAFTDEFDGFNFVQVDLYLVPDITGFESNLADSVNIKLTITAINDDGPINETTDVPSTNILSGNPIYVDDAERLLNIRPDRITTDGLLIIYPSGEPGSQFSNQNLPVMMVIEAPLNVEITETATYEIESQKVQMDIEDPIESIKVFIDSDNDFDFGADLDILAADDTMHFKEGSLIQPDTITNLILHPNTNETIIFDLGPEKYELFQDSTYITGKMRLLSNVDSQGNPTSSKLLSKDSLKILVYTSISVLVDPNDEEGN